MSLLGITPIISIFLTFFGAGPRACVDSTCISFLSSTQVPVAALILSTLLSLLF